MTDKNTFVCKIFDGTLLPLDKKAFETMGFKQGWKVIVSVKTPRSLSFNKLAHQIGRICSDNINSFHGMDAHSVLKRLQWESNIGCSSMAAIVPNVGPVEIRMPESFKFDSMSERRFREIISGLCRHISEKYWPTLTPEQIEAMAGVMVD